MSQPPPTKTTTEPGPDTATSVSPRALRTLLRQHARVMQMWGVDVVPVSPGELAGPEQSIGTTTPPSHEDPGPAQTRFALRSAERSPMRGPIPPGTLQPRSSEAMPKVDVTGAIAPESLGPPIHPLVRTDPERAKAQKLLDELQARYERDAPHKHFVTDHHCIVFGEGDPRARLVFVGEAPGAEEDKVGRPFVGRAGQLLDKMIVGLGLSRQDVYICNVLKTRPPNNATPTSDEAALCAPYLYEQLAIVNPAVIVTLGLPASRTLLNTMETMGALRGKWWQYQPPLELVARGAAPIPVMPTYHPAFLLRSYTLENRQKVWADLQLAGAKLGLKAGSGKVE